MIHEHSWGFSAISFDSNCGFQLGKATNRRKQWEVNHNKHMPDYDPVGMSILPQWTSFHGNRPVSVVSLHAYRSYIFTKLSLLLRWLPPSNRDAQTSKRTSPTHLIRLIRMDGITNRGWSKLVQRLFIIHPCPDIFTASTKAPRPTWCMERSFHRKADIAALHQPLNTLWVCARYSDP
jgi:hypothetical protein